MVNRVVSLKRPDAEAQLEEDMFPHDTYPRQWLEKSQEWDWGMVGICTVIGVVVGFVLYITFVGPYLWHHPEISYAFNRWIHWIAYRSFR